eukprot:2657510-Prymnesium_polylepis.1
MPMYLRSARGTENCRRRPAPVPTAGERPSRARRVGCANVAAVGACTQSRRRSGRSPTSSS